MDFVNELKIIWENKRLEFGANKTRFLNPVRV